MKLANVVRIWAMLVTLVLASRVPAEDWPQWRYDAYRSADSPEKLPSSLELQWVRQYAPRQQTWEDELNNDLITFDRVFEPIVLGNRMFLGFNDSDKVVALDIDTGRELWTFFTDGPVRLPPCAGNGKVYFTSDDGNLYCVSAEDGTLVWKFRGGPSARKVLGNGRVISAWPARGGPVLRDGTVFFAASIWPFMGTFIYALNAENGTVVWVNDGTGSQYIKQPHSAPSFAGVAPQGALVATRKILLVPGGRSVPAAFDLKTGNFLYYQLEDSGKGNGGSFVLSSETEFFVHTRLRGTRSYDLKTGKKSNFTANEPVVTTNRLYSGQDWSSLKKAVLDAEQKLVDAHQAEDDARLDITKGEEDNDREAYKKGTNALASAKRKIGRATAELGSAKKALDTNWAGAVLQAIGNDKKVRWEVPVDASGDVIKAGQNLYVAGTNALVSFYLPPDKGKAHLTWSNSVDGRVLRLLAANGKLFAVTLDGRIMAFGCEDTITPSGTTIARSSYPDPSAPTIVRQAGVPASKAPEAYALWFGVDDRAVLESVLRQSKLHIVVVEPDIEKVDKFRQHFTALEMYGSRVTLHSGDPLTFKAPPYIANIVIVGNAFAPHLADPPVLRAAYESVRPYGGRLWIWSDSSRTDALVRAVAAAGLSQAKISIGNGGVVVTREGALPGAADWNHQYGNVANTVKSDDLLVKLPLGLLWFGGNTHADVLPRHGHGPSEQVVAGRLFIEGMDCLSARDVYTGRVLWKKYFNDLGNYGVYYDGTYTNLPLTTMYNQKHIPGANARGANFIAMPDAVYLLATNKCLVLDPANGRVVRSIRLKADSSVDHSQWGYIGVCDDVLLAGIDFAHYTRRYGLGPTNNPTAANRPPPIVDLSASRGLIAFNRHTGEELWRVDARHSFLHNGIVAGNQRVYAIDKMPKTAEDKLKRRGRPVPNDYRVAAYHLLTGKLLWQVSTNVFGTWLGYSKDYDVLLQAGASATDRLKDEADKGMIVYNAQNGSLLWSNLAVKYTGPCILHGDIILTTPTSSKTNAGAFGLLDGNPRAVRNPLTSEPEPLRIFRSYGCNYPVACEHLVTFRSGAAGFYDLASHSGSGNFGGFKSGCSANLIAANGLLNAPDYTRTCSCPYQNQTSLAFVHWPDEDMEIWTYNQYGATAKDGIRIKRVGINLGAPGDRLAGDGTLWLEHPGVGGSSPNLSVAVRGSKTNYFRRHASVMQGDGPAWVMASGVREVEQITIAPETRKPAPPPSAPKKKSDEDEDKDEPDADSNGTDNKENSNTQTNSTRSFRRSSRGSAARNSGTNLLTTAHGTSTVTNATAKSSSTNRVEPPYVSTLSPAPYTIRLYFAEPDELASGERVFTVKLQGRPVLDNFDIVALTGGPRRGIIKEFRGVRVKGELAIALSRVSGSSQGPVISGVEMILEE